MLSLALTTILLAQTTIPCSNPAPIPARDLAYACINVDGTTSAGLLKWNGSLATTSAVWSGPVNPDGSQLGARICVDADSPASLLIVTLTTHVDQSNQSRYTLLPTLTPDNMAWVTKTFTASPWQMVYDFSSAAWLVGIQTITLN